MEVHRYEEILKRILDLFDILDGKRIIIFGAGNIGRIAGSILNTIFMSIDYYVDNDNDKCEMTILNKKI